MTWSMLAVSAILPLLIALPVAMLLWSRRQSTIGTVVGAAIVLIGTVFFMALEFGNGVHFRLMCAEKNIPCAPSNPSDFVRIFSYAIVGMVDVMVLFVLGASAEKRMSDRHRAAEWL